MDDLVTIGTFSMLSGLSVDALRHYDGVGVLKPAAVDPRTGYRRYSRDQLERAWRIAELRRADLSLDDVRTVLDDPAARRAVLDAHRAALVARGRDVDAMVAQTQRLLDEEGDGMQQTAVVVRLMAVNIGVRSTEELERAAMFWSTVLECEVEDWEGRGVSRQARVGRDAHAFFLNLRVRGADEPHHGHRSAFGIAVADLDATRARALTAGAVEHYPPTESEDQPRHCLIEDPVGNRAVLWQG